jgi:hypothetical protein
MFVGDWSLKLSRFTLVFWNTTKHTHTYHSRFISEEVAEASQIFLRDAHVLPKAMSITGDVIGVKPIAIWSQSISGVNAINPLVAFYDIHGRKREVLFYYFVTDTTRDNTSLLYKYDFCIKIFNGS